MVFWVGLLSFFFDKIIPASIELRFWIVFVLLCAGVGTTIGSWLYLFRPSSAVARRWFHPFQVRVTIFGRYLAAFSLLLGCGLILADIVLVVGVPVQLGN
jgi:hypothetical protein